MNPRAPPSPTLNECIRKFHLPIAQAAFELGSRTDVLLDVIRSGGYSYWPFQRDTHLTVNECRQNLHLPIEHAAEKMGVPSICLSSFIQSLGYTDWPFEITLSFSDIRPLLDQPQSHAVKQLGVAAHVINKILQEHGFISWQHARRLETDHPPGPSITIKDRLRPRRRINYYEKGTASMCYQSTIPRPGTRSSTTGYRMTQFVNLISDDDEELAPPVPRRRKSTCTPIKDFVDLASDITVKEEEKLEVISVLSETPQTITFRFKGNKIATQHSLKNTDSESISIEKRATTSESAAAKRNHNEEVRESSWKNTETESVALEKRATTPELLSPKRHCIKEATSEDCKLHRQITTKNAKSELVPIEKRTTSPDPSSPKRLRNSDVTSEDYKLGIQNLKRDSKTESVAVEKQTALPLQFKQVTLDDCKRQKRATTPDPSSPKRLRNCDVTSEDYKFGIQNLKRDVKTEFVAVEKRTASPLLFKQVTLDDCKRYFHLPLHRAANALGVTPFIVMRVIRSNNFADWPFEVRKATVSLTENLVSLDDCRKYFHLPIERAAKELGVKSSSISKVLHENGVPNWPYISVNEVTSNGFLPDTPSKVSNPVSDATENPKGDNFRQVRDSFGIVFDVSVTKKR